MVVLESTADHAPQWLPPLIAAPVLCILCFAIYQAILWLPLEGLHAKGEIVRLVPALAGAVASICLVRVFLKHDARGRQTASAGNGRLSMIPITMTLALGFAVTVPATYLKARGRHFQSQLTKLQSQGQLELARRLATQLLVLDPDTVIDGRSIKLMHSTLESEIQKLEKQVAANLAANSTTAARIERARQLAVLGRTEEALTALQPIASNDPTYIDACNLRGTIYEMQRDWPASRHWYRRAHDNLLASDESPDPTGRLLTAIKGIAYSHRKQGQHREAEEAYRRLLRVHPSAETHFLLAEFYRDTQQATKAYASARQAQELNALRFQQRADELIDDLVTNHFGCLAVSRQIRREHDLISSAAAGSLIRSP